MDEYHKRARDVQQYLDNLFAFEDDILINVKETMDKNGLQPISVTPLIGKTLFLLSRLTNVKKILEIGTLGGYSTIWLARSLPAQGTVTSLEIDPKHAKVAKENVQKAKLENCVTIMEGPALEIMRDMVDRNTDPFDLIFLDADKPAYPDYIEPMIQLSRPGGLIIADNLIRRGKVVDPLPHDRHANALARFNQILAQHPKLESVILPTLVGYVGGDLDGLSISRVLQDM